VPPYLLVQLFRREGGKALMNWWREGKYGNGMYVKGMLFG